MVAFGVYLVGLAGVSVFNRLAAERFLGAFASSAKAHYVEQFVRIVVGASLILFSGSMDKATAFLVFGWILVGTSTGLLLVPWRLHHRYAEWSVPLALRYRVVYMVGALALGLWILWSVWSIRG